MPVWTKLHARIAAAQLNTFMTEDACSDTLYLASSSVTCISHIEALTKPGMLYTLYTSSSFFQLSHLLACSCSCSLGAFAHRGTDLWHA